MAVQKEQLRGQPRVISSSGVKWLEEQGVRIHQDYRTVEYVTIDRGDDLTFTFHDSTTIISYDFLEVRDESAIGNPARRYPVIPVERSSAEKKSELP